MKRFLVLSLLIFFSVVNDAFSRKRSGSSTYSHSSTSSTTNNSNYINESILGGGREYIKNRDSISLSTGKVLDHQDTEIVSAVPYNNNEYENVYKKIPSESALDSIKRSSSRLSKIIKKGNIELANNSTSFLDYIKSVNNKKIVIVGHSIFSKKGHYLIFRDGSQTSIDFLHHVAAEHGNTILAITCNSEDLKLKGNISLNDAVRLAEVAHLNSGKGNGKIYKEIGNELLKMKNTRLIIYGSSLYESNKLIPWISYPNRHLFEIYTYIIFFCSSLLLILVKWVVEPGTVTEKHIIEASINSLAIVQERISKYKVLIKASTVILFFAVITHTYIFYPILLIRGEETSTFVYLSIFSLSIIILSIYIRYRGPSDIFSMIIWKASRFISTWAVSILSGMIWAVFALGIPWIFLIIILTIAGHDNFSRIEIVLFAIAGLFAFGAIMGVFQGFFIGIKNIFTKDSIFLSFRTFLWLMSNDD